MTHGYLEGYMIKTANPLLAEVERLQKIKNRQVLSDEGMITKPAIGGVLGASGGAALGGSGSIAYDAIRDQDINYTRALLLTLLGGGLGGAGGAGLGALSALKERKAAYT